MPDNLKPGLMKLNAKIWNILTRFQAQNCFYMYHCYSTIPCCFCVVFLVPLPTLMGKIVHQTFLFLEERKNATKIGCKHCKPSEHSTHRFMNCDFSRDEMVWIWYSNTNYCRIKMLLLKMFKKYWYTHFLLKSKNIIISTMHFCLHKH